MRKEEYLSHALTAKEAGEYGIRYSITDDVIHALSSAPNIRQSDIDCLLGKADKLFEFNLADVRAAQQEKLNPEYLLLMKKGHDAELACRNADTNTRRHVFLTVVKPVTAAIIRLRKSFATPDCLFYKEA